MDKTIRLCFVGPLMGRFPAEIISQGEIISRLFEDAGYSVLRYSSYRNRIVRMLDIVINLFIKKAQIDILCLQVYSGPSFLIAVVAGGIGKILGLKIIMHLHGGNLPELAKRRPAWFKRVVVNADAVVAPSEYLARVVRSFGVQPLVIPNLIELKQYPYRPPGMMKPRLFWMRSFHSIYNPEMAVQALKILRESFKDATLTMSGSDRGELKKIKQIVRKLHLSEAVRFTGFLDKRGKISEASGHDIYLNTNRIDNMPVSVIEMAAIGLPVISTNVGGVPDLLKNKKTALLVPDDEALKMAEAVRTLIESPELAMRLSRNGRQLAETFSYEKVFPQWQLVFENLIKKL